MSNENLGKLVNDLYLLLDEYDTEVRTKAIQAVQVLFGDIGENMLNYSYSRKEELSGLEIEQNGLQLAENACDFFEEKQPKSKIEELAVAARFLELSTDNHSITKSDFEDAIVNSRRNFDSNNFRRDIGNAKFKGLFTKTRDKGVFTLSHYGQKYVDTLPNREGLVELNKPNGAGRRSSASTTRKKKRTKKTEKKI